MAFMVIGLIIHHIWSRRCHHGDHVLHLRLHDIVDLSKLLGNAGEVAEGDPGGAVENLLAGVLPTHLAGHHGEGSAKSMVPSMPESIFLSSLTSKPRESMATLGTRISQMMNDKQTRVGGQV